MAHPLKGAPVTAAPTEAITTDHRNEVYLVGEVITVPEDRTFADGRDVVTFRLDVRAQTDAGAIRDSFDITIATARTRKAALGWDVGDTVEVEGVVRRKFHRVGAGSRAFVVIEAARAKRVRRG
jgi:single-strand DNA-binding protein